MAADRFSSQLVSSWPTTELALEPQEFREAYCRYLGAESPACRALVGRSIPVAAGDGVTLCDRHGLTLSRRTKSNVIRLKLGGQQDQSRCSHCAGHPYEGASAKRWSMCDTRKQERCGAIKGCLDQE